MLQLVDVGSQSIDSLAEVVGAERVQELRDLAAPLRGLRVLHINATPYGGGVSELLRSTVPLENDLGLNAEWRIIFGETEFFRVTKTIHDALQGEPHHLTPDEQETYLNYNYINAREFDPGDYDVIVIHDPQPAALLECSGGKGGAKWVWRCHIDTSSPSPGVWEFFRGFLKGYDSAVFTMSEFVPPDFPELNLAIMPPAIDPLSPKNMDISPKFASRLLAWLGMRPDEPFITQVSRFDMWKDPFGVLEAYRMIKEEIPGVHLALVGSMALDDPTAWEIHSRLTEEDMKDPNMHIFTNLTGVSNVEVNAFQRLAKVIIQKSIREGFGLVVSEALWKSTPVVAGRAGGIPLQLAGGGGFLIDSVEECAQRTTELLKNPALAASMGRRGHDHVREEFLITRLLRDQLRLFSSL